MTASTGTIFIFLQEHPIKNKKGGVRVHEGGEGAGMAEEGEEEEQKGGGERKQKSRHPELKRNFPKNQNGKPPRRRFIGRCTKLLNVAPERKNRRELSETTKCR